MHFLLLLFFTQLAFITGIHSLSVRTTEGLVVGTQVSQKVRRFLGIPYARVKRWEPPYPASKRDYIFYATKFGDSCPQELSKTNELLANLTGLRMADVRESEDCLNLNIWAPSIDRNQGTAVMIWIYGGAFEFGTSNTAVYDGEDLIANNDDVLLVTINYRTNIFGFPGAPQLSGRPLSQNFGALDVDTAIQWVYKNIAGFGGDPERITIFGQSAGSAMVSTYPFWKGPDTPVKGIIQQSGSLVGMPAGILAFGGLFDPTSWTTVAKAVGCGRRATEHQLACMKSTPFQKLEEIAIHSDLTFAPVQDGITFFSDILSRALAGKFLPLPVMVGNTLKDGDVFVAGLEQLDFGFKIPLITRLASDLMTKLIFSCPSGVTANAYTRANISTWRYRYDGTFPGATKESPSRIRAFHGSEIPFIFGTYNKTLFGGPSEDALSRYMQSVWVAFARDPHNGPAGEGWPRYDSRRRSLVVLGTLENVAGVQFSSEEEYDFGCELFEFMASALLPPLEHGLGISGA